MKEYAEEPKMGPTETKHPGRLDFDHDMLHGADKMAPGDRVKLIVHGHVQSNRGKDEFGPGHISIDAHGVEHHPVQDDDKKPKKNASTMRMDELKQHITDLMEKDENMEGHSEAGVKEKGEDE